MILYRLVPPSHASPAFSGEGAYRYGGRWNSPGVRVVYTSSSVALAVLEVLAYRKPKRPLAPRCLFRVILPDRQLRRIIAETLPEDWNAYPYPESTQLVGDAWMERGEAVALAVPSVLAPQEHNVVLNCEHPAFADLRIEGPEDFPFDPRLAPDARWQ